MFQTPVLTPPHTSLVHPSITVIVFFQCNITPWSDPNTNTKGVGSPEHVCITSIWLVCILTLTLMPREALLELINSYRTGESVTIAPKKLHSAVIYIQENDSALLDCGYLLCGMLYNQNIEFSRIALLHIILILTTTTQ